jgi:hypothetical protein
MNRGLEITLPDEPAIQQLAARLRRSDREELAALLGSSELPDQATLLDALLGCVRRSSVCFVLRAKEPLAITGVIPHLQPGQGYAPWLLGAERVSALALPFMRSVRVIMQIYRRDFLPLSNLVDARQRTSCRFLQSLGFRLAEAERLSPENPFLFRKFYLEENTCAG